MKHMAIGYSVRRLVGVLVLAVTTVWGMAAEGAGRWNGWDDASKTLPEVDFDVIPLGEVVRYLQEACDDQFDVILPEPVRGDPAVDPSTGLPLPAAGAPHKIETYDKLIKLRLRNVTVTEVFEAMNMLFDEQRDLVRWDLKMNGKRPTALLQVLEAPQPRLELQPPLPRKRAVFFVGNLIGEPNRNHLDMAGLVSVLHDVAFTAREGERPVKREPPYINYHTGTELLVVLGTEEEIEIVTQTLEALKERAQWKAQPGTVSGNAGTAGGQGSLKH